MNTDSIFSPITINSLAIKNRLVMSSMVTQYAAGNGEVTDQMWSGRATATDWGSA